MQLTYILELLKPTKRKENIFLNNIAEVVKNRQAVAVKLKAGEINLSSADFKELNLPSAVKNQNIREVKALYKQFLKSNSKKENIEFKENQPICYNNQNYKIDHHIISIPLYTNKCKRFAFPVKQAERFEELRQHIDSGCKLGKASLFYKRGKWYFAVTIKIAAKKTSKSNLMGIDIGLRQLAVASIKNPQGKEINRQFHNGKQAGFIRKKYRMLRRKLGQSKKVKAIKKINDKEQRWMTDLNHKISRQLINFAVQKKVGTIIMENLENIRNTTKSLNRADRNIHSWTFYQLQQFIKYKAELAGIKVEYINPKYTSQSCSKCNKIKKSNRKANLYSCECGNHIHADLNASRNIANKYLEQQPA
ncbi:IS605 OrfB family transposase [Halanaerobium saccharolyticum]|uniref:IS605 OrfB family transposase n=1 Tax=Halanaerobium saccharolyticum TaxID=43595 RepID=A0A4R7YKP6_9FIRM|nr:RNA-guided endonuclease TnpB family protein [Halanaerobium saccharolyticum]RAK04167.1 IS605 OrfB family transposase [Halanaerobium saccharolyticum]TDV97962.1 IS605 OrfB family transposase [Halanaerobium saccharolyticum]TDX51023.1 IS605 OrfB family transposase [Halanaerobium saccharolyticum]